MSRTSTRHWRVYAGGYDLSGYTREIGPLATEFAHQPQAALSDAALGALPGQPSIRLGSLNAFLDSSAGGLHALHAAPGGRHIVTVALGVQAAPTEGDPAFVWEGYQNTYLPSGDAGMIPATVDFGEYAVDATTQTYEKAWGHLLNPGTAAITGANNGGADHDNGAASSAGGYGVLQVLAGDGTATLSIQAAATDSDAAFDVAGALLTFDTTDSSSPFAEIKALPVSTTVERYLRWQLALGTATSVTALFAFVRG